MLEPSIYKYCHDLDGATQSARRSGADSLTVLNGLVGTIALQIKASGGDDGDVAAAFLTFSECYANKGEA